MAALWPPTPETPPPRRAPAPQTRIRSWAVATPHGSSASLSRHGQERSPWKMSPPASATSRPRPSLVGAEQPLRSVQPEQRQRVLLAVDDRRVGQRVAVELGRRPLGQLAGGGRRVGGLEL